MVVDVLNLASLLFDVPESAAMMLCAVSKRMAEKCNVSQTCIVSADWWRLATAQISSLVALV